MPNAQKLLWKEDAMAHRQNFPELKGQVYEREYLKKVVNSKPNMLQKQITYRK